MTLIEPLEARIAPAAVLVVNDVDGDLVTITSSKGTVNDLVGVIFLGPLVGFGQQLLRLDLRLIPDVFAGANISVVAKPFDFDNDGKLDGDGLVNVGSINASGIDVGTVFVDGDLGRLIAGDGISATSACKGLTVQSLGRFGTSTGATDLISNFDGKLDRLTVKSDVLAALVFVADSGGANGKIGTVLVGGSLIGGATTNSGGIFTEDGLGAVMIKGDVAGGIGETSGSITSVGDIGSVTIGGSLLGGASFSSGVIFSSQGAVGSVKIGGSIVAGEDTFTGRVFAKTTLASVSVGGSVLGGAFGESGQIHTDGDMGAVKIARDVIGGTATNGGRIISPGGDMGTVTIGGSLRGVAGATGEIRSGGDMGLVKIAGNIEGVGGFSGSISAVGALAGVMVGGSVIGGGIQSGRIFSSEAIGIVKIAGDLRGGTGNDSGQISADSLRSVSIGGSVFGGAGEETGYIFTIDGMGFVKIGGDVVGGTSLRSGLILAQDALAGVSIGGSLRGGPANVTGTILAGEALGPVKIGGDIIGGNLTGAADLDSSGSIQGERIVSVFIGGSIRPGVDAGAGKLIRNGTIRASDDLGPITIKGSLIGTAHEDGNSADGDFTPAIIAARGQETPSATSNVAIKSVTIGGRVEQAQILAGYTSTQFLTGTNGDAQIGAVKVGGDWIASRLVAGTDEGGDDVPGSADDTFLGGGSAAIVSKIASITIKGQALGTVGGSDFYYFLAQKIGALKIGTTAIPLTAGNDSLVIGATGDLFAVDLF